MYRYYLYLFYGLVITFQTCSKGIKCYILLLSKDINVDKDENKLKSIEYELTEKDKNKIEEEEEEEEEEDRIKKREEYVKKLARKIAENNINIYDKNKIASILNNNKDDDEFIKSIFKHFDLEVKGVIKKKKETKSKEIKSMSDLTTKNFDYIEINFFQNKFKSFIEDKDFLHKDYIKNIQVIVEEFNKQLDKKKIFNTNDIISYFNNGFKNKKKNRIPKFHISYKGEKGCYIHSSDISLVDTIYFYDHDFCNYKNKERNIKINGISCKLYLPTKFNLTYLINLLNDLIAKDDEDEDVEDDDNFKEISDKLVILYLNEFSKKKFIFKNKNGKIIEDDNYIFINNNHSDIESISYKEYIFKKKEDPSKIKEDPSKQKVCESVKNIKEWLTKNGYNEKTKYDLYIWEENGNVEKQINKPKYYKKYLWNKFIVEIKDKKEENKEIEKKEKGVEKKNEEEKKEENKEIEKKGEGVEKKKEETEEKTEEKDKKKDSKKDLGTSLYKKDVGKKGLRKTGLGTGSKRKCCSCSCKT